MENFAKYAQIYNLIYQDKQYEKEAAKICSLLRESEVNTSSDILEIGCGTGRHLDYVLKTYPNTIGVEPSSLMIEQAPPAVRSRITQQSATNLSFNKKFHAIYMLFHVFSYIDNINLFFQQLEKYTQPGGIVVFDFWQSHGVFFQKPELRSKWFEEKTLKVHRIATPSIDAHGDLVDVKYDIYLHDKDMDTVSYFGESHRMFLHSTKEIILLAKQYGFDLLKTCDLTGNQNTQYTNWDTGIMLKKVES